MQLAVPESYRVYIDPPVFGQINPPAPAGRKTTYEYYEITAICRELKEAGYDQRAIVVKRKMYSSGMPADYDMSKPSAWGFVVDLEYSQPRDGAYVPIKVTWVDGTVSKHWPEDLFLIHEGINVTYLSNKFKRQLHDDPPV